MTALIVGRSAVVARRRLSGTGVVSGRGGTGRLYRPVAFRHLRVKTRAEPGAPIMVMRNPADQRFCGQSWVALCAAMRQSLPTPSLAQANEPPSLLMSPRPSIGPAATAGRGTDPGGF